MVKINRSFIYTLRNTYSLPPSCVSVSVLHHTLSPHNTSCGSSGFPPSPALPAAPAWGGRVQTGTPPPHAAEQKGPSRSCKPEDCEEEQGKVRKGYDIKCNKRLMLSHVYKGRDEEKRRMDKGIKEK